MKKQYEDYAAMINKKAKSWQITLNIPEWEECVSLANLAYAEADAFYDPEKGSSFSTYLWNGIDIQFKIYASHHFRWNRTSQDTEDIPSSNGEVRSFHHKLMDLSRDGRRVVNYIFQNPDEFCYEGWQIRRSNGSLKKKISSLGYSWRQAGKIISEIQTMLREEALA